MSASLNQIYISQQRSLFWTVMRIVRDAQTAEELAQESYVRARRAMEAGPVEHIEAFLHQTARNLALDHLRRRKTRAGFEKLDLTEEDLINIADSTPSAEETLIQQDRLRLFEQALEQLPARARQVWVLSRVEGWPYPKIAAHLGVSGNTVFNDMKMAMGHLSDVLKRLDRD